MAPSAAPSLAPTLAPSLAPVRAPSAEARDGETDRVRHETLALVLIFSFCAFLLVLAFVLAVAYKKVNRYKLSSYAMLEQSDSDDDGGSDTTSQMRSAGSAGGAAPYDRFVADYQHLPLSWRCAQCKNINPAEEINWYIFYKKKQAFLSSHFLSFFFQFAMRRR